MAMALSGLLLPLIRCQLSVVVNFSFSLNTLFLSSLGFMTAQYTLVSSCRSIRQHQTIDL